MTHRQTLGSKLPRGRPLLSTPAQEASTRDSDQPTVQNMKFKIEHSAEVGKPPGNDHELADRTCNILPELISRNSDSQALAGLLRHSSTSIYFRKPPGANSHFTSICTRFKHEHQTITHLAAIFLAQSSRIFCDKCRPHFQCRSTPHSFCYFWGDH
jgi:hypothetical protein